MQMFLPYFFLCKKVLLNNNNRDRRANLRLEGQISDSILGGGGGGEEYKTLFLSNSFESIGGHVSPLLRGP